MNTMENTAKILIALGIIIMISGIVFYLISKTGLGTFHLPGDIVVKKEKYTFYFPLATCIVLSIILSVIFNIIGRR